MTNIDEVYHSLTGIDIETQRRLWDERGKGYYGEYLVFKELYPKLTGCCKILMNLQIPTGDGRTTEIDLLLIHETGLYVFEMKHYKGTIYGRSADQKWTQYFRTAPNSHFHNPILQNQYHIHALQKIFPYVPIYSLIVFTNPECDLRIEHNELGITVCKLDSLYSLLYLLETQNKLFDINHIDDIFNKLVSFSPLTAKPVTVDGESVLFYQYINELVEDFHNEKENVKTTYLAAKKTEQKKTLATIAITAVSLVVCIVLSTLGCSQYRAYADSRISASEQKLSEFAQKFEHVAAFNNGNITFSDNLVSVSDVVLGQSSDVENTAVISCKLTHTGTDYGIFVTQDTAITIILKDGTVKECKIFNEKYPYNSDVYLDNYLAKESRILPHEFYETAVDEIAYIKLTDVGVWTYVQSKRKTISTSYEIELYNAE